MIKQAEQFVPLKVNAEKEGAELAKQHRVEGFPTVLFVDADGAAAGRIVGYKGPADFAADMKRVATEYAELPRLRAQVKANPRNAAAQARLATMLAGRDDKAGAYAALSAAAKLDPRNKTGRIAEAYNALGDAYQNSAQYDRAIGLFRQAQKVGKTPREVAYSRISIAVCYLSSNRAAKAVPELKALTTMKGAPKEYRDTAAQYLEMLKQRGIR